MVVLSAVQLEQDEHVVRKPADEESSDERRHDFEGFGVFGHPVVSKFEDDDGVADDDDEEGDDEPGKKAAHCDYLVTVWVQRVIVVANGRAHVWAHIPENRRGNAHSDGENPRQQNNNVRHFNGAIVLGPNRKHDRHEAVDADDDQEEDAAEHVDEQKRRGEFAHEAAEDPLLHRHLDDAEREEGAEDEVRDGEAQVPGGVDRLLHLEARNPDDQSVPEESEQKNEHADHQQRHAQAVLYTSRLVRENWLLVGFSAHVGSIVVFVVVIVRICIFIIKWRIHVASRNRAVVNVSVGKKKRHFQ